MKTPYLSDGEFSIHEKNLANILIKLKETNCISFPIKYNEDSGPETVSFRAAYYISDSNTQFVIRMTNDQRRILIRVNSNNSATL